MKTTNKLIVFAGPNGSGKSTIFEHFINSPIMEGVHYINADHIAKEWYNDVQDEYQRNMRAAELAESRRERCLNLKQDFAFETVLSTDRNLKLMQRAKDNGYDITTIYVLTESPEINIQRVKKRVTEGGHDVEADKIRIRYDRCMSLLPEVIKISNQMLLYDNSIKYSLMLYKKQEKILLITKETSKLFDKICNIMDENNIKYKTIIGFEFTSNELDYITNLKNIENELQEEDNELNL